MNESMLTIVRQVVEGELTLLRVVDSIYRKRKNAELKGFLDFFVLGAATVKILHLSVNGKTFAFSLEKAILHRAVQRRQETTIGS